MGWSLSNLFPGPRSASGITSGVVSVGAAHAESRTRRNKEGNRQARRRLRYPNRKQASTAPAHRSADRYLNGQIADSRTRDTRPFHKPPDAIRWPRLSPKPQASHVTSCETHIAVASRNWPRLHKTGRGLLNSPLTIMSSRATRLGARRTEQPDNREECQAPEAQQCSQPAACCGDRSCAGPCDGRERLRKCRDPRRGMTAAEMASLGLRAEPELDAMTTTRQTARMPMGRDECPPSEMSSRQTTKGANTTATHCITASIFARKSADGERRRTARVPVRLHRKS